MRKVALAVPVLVMLASCSSESTPTSTGQVSSTTSATASAPPSTNEPATTVGPSTTLGRIRTQAIPGTQVTLRYDVDVSPDFLSTISGYLLEAHREVGDAGPVTLHTYSNLDEYVRENVAVTRRAPQIVRGNIESGGGAEALQRVMFLYEVTQKARPAEHLRSAVLHEYFHTRQFFLSGYKRTQGGDSPRWLFEGSAVYQQLRTAEALGYAPPPNGMTLSYSTNKARRIANVKRANYGPLSTFEMPGTAAEGGGSHDLGYIAADYIAATYGENGLKHGYWEALSKSDWRTAFSSTFGVDPDQFYANFESYRRTL